MRSKFSMIVKHSSEHALKLIASEFFAATITTGANGGEWVNIRDVLL